VALQHAVLALLTDGPSHGYQLRANFERAVGPQWGGLNIGHTYQLLDRLSRDGLVRSQRQPQPVKPDRLVYELTAAGQAELQRWLAEPAERARGHRDDLFLKLLAASHLPDPDAVGDVLRQQRTYLLRQLHALAQARRCDDDRDPLNDLVAASAELHLRADLALLDLAEQTPLPPPASAAPGSAEQAVPPATAAS
jgi:DNA-binding PadR family transcriptional regulator